MVGCLSVWFLISRLSECLVGCLSVCFLIGRLSWVFKASVVGFVWVSGSSLVGCLECLLFKASVVGFVWVSGSSLVGCLEWLVPQWSAVWVFGSSMVYCLSVCYLIGRLSWMFGSSLFCCLSVWFLIGRLSELSGTSLVGCLSCLLSHEIPLVYLICFWCALRWVAVFIVFSLFTFLCLNPVSLLFACCLCPISYLSLSFSSLSLVAASARPLIDHWTTSVLLLTVLSPLVSHWSLPQSPATHRSLNHFSVVTDSSVASSLSLVAASKPGHS